MPAAGLDDVWYDAQWGHAAMEVPDAWAAGSKARDTASLRAKSTPARMSLGAPMPDDKRMTYGSPRM